MFLALPYPVFLRRFETCEDHIGNSSSSLSAALPVFASFWLDEAFLLGVLLFLSTVVAASFLRFFLDWEEVVLSSDSEFLLSPILSGDSLLEERFDLTDPLLLLELSSPLESELLSGSSSVAGSTTRFCSSFLCVCVGFSFSLLVFTSYTWPLDA